MEPAATLKRAWNLPLVLKLFKWPVKIIAHAYIYQLAEFGDLMSCGSKIYSKMHPVLCTNTHHDVTDLVNHVMVKTTKSWISWELNVTFQQNKKMLNLCLRWYILRNYFVAELTYKNILTNFLELPTAN